AVLRLQVAAVIADVADAGVGVFGDPVAGGEQRRAVEAGRRDRHGKLVEAAAALRVGAGIYDLLDRAAFHHDRLDRRAERLLPFVGDPVGVAVEPDRDDVFRARHDADRD